MNRYAHAIYCDDLRQEVGNKISLLGIYHGKIIVPSFPVVLPKLCIALWAVTPIDRPFSKMQLRLYVDDKVVLDADVPSEGLAQGGNTEAQNEEKTRVQVFHTALSLGNIRVEAASRMKIRIQTEEEELKAGGVDIESANPQPTKMAP